MPHGDPRGRFTEWYRADVLAKETGFGLTLAQANHSVSARGVLRGVHFALVPPGQAKYVYCPAGKVLDVIVDIRVGSPTFGVHDSVVLDSEQPRAVYLAEGLGHAFVSLADNSSVTYLVSTGYPPRVRHQPDGPRARPALAGGHEFGSRQGPAHRRAAAMEQCPHATPSSGRGTLKRQVSVALRRRQTARTRRRRPAPSAADWATERDMAACSPPHAHERAAGCAASAPRAAAGSRVTGRTTRLTTRRKVPAGMETSAAVRASGA